MTTGGVKGDVGAAHDKNVLAENLRGVATKQEWWLMGQAW